MNISGSSSLRSAGIGRPIELNYISWIACYVQLTQPKELEAQEEMSHYQEVHLP